MEELQSSVPTKIDIAQKQADLSLGPLEDELMALNDHVEKVQTQLHTLISAPNVDQTAVTEITHKVAVISPAHTFGGYSFKFSENVFKSITKTHLLAERTGDQKFSYQEPEA